MNIPTLTPPPDETAPGSDQITGGGVIILYAVPITVFMVVLIIIINGAFVTHRNQEQHGSQQARQGRPRQSWAKGLARAVIESITIVRFGENNVKSAAQRDIELAAISQTNGFQSTTITAKNSSVSPETIAATSGPSTSTLATAEDGLSTTEPNPVQTQAGSLGCSICLDEEIRMLSCRHQFHPSCIDPWLLDVSRTCPIW
jgi:hypothetical protein